MKEKGISLAGRLGNPTLKPAPTEETPEADNYGVSRLGIVLDDDGDFDEMRETIVGYAAPPRADQPAEQPQTDQEAPAAEPAPHALESFARAEGLVPAPREGAATGSQATTRWLAAATAVVVGLSAWWVWRSLSEGPQAAPGQRAVLGERPPVQPWRATPPAAIKPAPQPPVGPQAEAPKTDLPAPTTPPASHVESLPEHAPAVKPAFTAAPPVELAAIVPPPAPQGLTPPPSLEAPAPTVAPPPSAATNPDPPAAVGTAGPSAGSPAPPKAETDAKPVISLACPAGFDVSGIMRWADGPVAMINDRLVGVGDVVNGAKILKISDFSIEIELKGKIYMIAVATPGSIKPAPEPAKDSTVEDAPAPTTQPAEQE